MQHRVTELEIRLTHLEDTIDILDRAIIDQRGIIESMKLQLEILEKKVKSMQESNIAPESEERPPPHY